MGRGEKESKCIIVSSDEINEITSKRLEAIVKSNDGFSLSEEDLKIRGPGEIDKTKQSGFPEYKMADPLDFELIQNVNKVASKIIDDDPDLLKNKFLKNIIKDLNTTNISLG